jgi:hypothetical protein
MPENTSKLRARRHLGVSLMSSRARSPDQAQPFADGMRLANQNVPQKILHCRNLFAKENAPDPAFPCQQMSGAQDRVRVATLAVVGKILVSFYAAIDRLLPPGYVAVIVKLMNNWSKDCQIHNR